MSAFVNASKQRFGQQRFGQQRMMRCFCYFSYVAFALIFLYLPVSSQSRIIPRNFDIADTLTREAAVFFAKQLRSPLFPQLAPTDTLRIQMHTHEASWMLEQALFSAFLLTKNLSQKRFRSNDTAVPHHRLIVRITDVATRYYSCVHDVDALKREISCAVQANMETRDGTTQVLEPFTKTYHDTVSRRILASLENKQYAFTQANIPDAEPNFWKQVLEPAIVIVAAGIMVALFFFVRTQ
jgi:hypothetical protein